MGSTTYEQQVGTGILDQLAHAPVGAGVHLLGAMVKATDFQTLKARPDGDGDFVSSPGIGFRFRGSRKWTGVEIFLDRATDTYSMRFYKFGRATVFITGEWMHDVHAGDLERIFREQTGLFTHLQTVGRPCGGA